MEPFYNYYLFEEEKQIYTTKVNHKKIGFQPNTLLEYKCLKIFLKRYEKQVYLILNKNKINYLLFSLRLNVFGFTNRYQYEELFALFLIVYNMEYDEYLESKYLFKYFSFYKFSIVFGS